jgi:hypothetical protein
MYHSYLPCLLYGLVALSLGPLNLVALPPLRFPNVIFLALYDPFAFAMLVYFNNE